MSPKGRHLQHEYWVLAFGEDCAAPLGLNKCVSMINPGLCRSVVLKGSSMSSQSLLYLIILMRLPCICPLIPCSCAKHFLYSHLLIPFSSILRESKSNHANIHSPYEHNSRSLRTPQCRPNNPHLLLRLLSC